MSPTYSSGHGHDQPSEKYTHTHNNVSKIIRHTTNFLCCYMCVHVMGGVRVLTSHVLTVLIGTSDVVFTRHVLCDAVELSAAVPVLITLHALAAVVTS